MFSTSGELIVSRYIAESITTDPERFGRVGLRQLCTKLVTVLYTVDKGLCGRNVLHQLLLILLCICSQSVRPLTNNVV